MPWVLAAVPALHRRDRSGAARASPQDWRGVTMPTGNRGFTAAIISPSAAANE